MTEPSLSLAEMKQFVRNHFEDFVNKKRSEVALLNFSSDFTCKLRTFLQKATK